VRKAHTIATLVCLIGSAALRGMGNMRASMIILGIVNVINMLV